MRPNLPLSRDLVLIGGGHTHALVLRKWGMDKLAGARVTLVNPDVTAPYTGMLPGFVAGHYVRDDLDIDLVKLTRFAGARLVLDKALGIDRGQRLIHLEARPPIRYDVASIDIGVTADLPQIEGFATFAHSAKPLGPFARSWQAFTTAQGKGRCVVIGGGVAGVELALAMAHRLKGTAHKLPSLTLIESTGQLLEGVAPGTRHTLIKELEHYNVQIITRDAPVSFAEHAVTLASGRVIDTDFTVSAAGARPHAWLAATGLAMTDGYINVAPSLISETDANIFAVGDCAHLGHAPRPKAGVFAVREAPVLYHNLRAALKGQTFKAYHPQKSYLKLISMGAKSAVADKFAMTVSGRWLWDIKNAIDKRFMKQLSVFPDMLPGHIPPNRALSETPLGDQMLCGGCGSKVSSASLSAALSTLPQPIRSDVMKGRGDDAAILRVGDALQVISTDHLRAFTQDPYTLARIAAVHALGDIWAMGALPQSALASLIIPEMSERMQSDTVAEIMRAIANVLKDAGADLLGGHTSMGAELTIGLTVTGLLAAPAIGLDGARPGDALILTKPIGTGVILAAEMRGMANGHDVALALVSMTHPLACASRLLAPHANAMTDVTGFGLAGHLLTILDASEVSATLTLDHIPLLSGAERLASEGVRSSIWAANARSSDRMSLPSGPKGDLLFDPQTAGGLLAAIPASEAATVLAAFEEAGEFAAHIGNVEHGDGNLEVL